MSTDDFSTPAYAPAPGVVATDLGDELVLLDPSSGEMFSLNESGRRIWQALDDGEEAAAAALVEAFDVEPERAAADVRALVDALLQAGLLVRGARNA